MSREIITGNLYMYNTEFLAHMHCILKNICGMLTEIHVLCQSTNCSTKTIVQAKVL